MAEHELTTMPKTWTQLKDRSGAIPPRPVKSLPGLAHARAWAKTNGDVAIGIGDQDAGNVSVVTSLTRGAAADLYEQLGKAITKVGKAS